MRDPARLIGDNAMAAVRFKKVAWATLILYVASIPAAAEGMQFHCGASEGYSHFSDQGLAKGHGGWDEDGISNGETIIRVDLDKATAQVRFKDASGTWSDVADVGGSAELWHVLVEPMTFGVLVAYTGETDATIEVSTISEINFDRKSARLTTTQSRVAEMFTNSRVLTSICRVSAC